MTNIDPRPTPLSIVKSKLPYFSLSALAAEAETVAARAEAASLSGAALGPVTGFPKLDALLGGYLAPATHIIHGAPGSGKTSLALQIAATCGIPALFLTVEASRVDIFFRLCSRVNSTYLNRFSSGELDAGARAQFFARTIDAFPQLSIGDATETVVTISDIEKVMKVVRGDSPSALLVIDSIHEWAESQATARQTEYEYLGSALKLVRDYSRREEVAVLMLAERNRISMATGGQNASAGTRKFEYKAHTVIDLGRKDEKAAEETGWPRAIDIYIAKNRSGSSGDKVTLWFDGRIQTFSESPF
ncbi:MAG: RAD55 family ATPase [Candidatus Dormibacteria bacterium]